MNENVKITCACELGYDKGALKKTIENNVFTIYGNLNKNNYIVIRYHGELIDNIMPDNYENNLFVSYYFDGDDKKVQHLPLAKCNKCIGESYCTLISLEEHNNICFYFSLHDNSSSAHDNSFLTEPEKQIYNLNIFKDPISDIFEKYGLEENTNLPVLEQESNLQIYKFIQTIKSFFTKILKRH